jgi:hypothetical protein
VNQTVLEGENDVSLFSVDKVGLSVATFNDFAVSGKLLELTIFVWRARLLVKLVLGKFFP